MGKWLCALGVVFGIAWLAPFDQMYRWGPLGPRLSAEDLAQLSRASASAEQAPWALLAWYSQILPETWYADAFLPPSVSTGRLRRGQVQHLACTPGGKNAPCLAWRVIGNPGAYVQVSDGAPFDRTMRIRRPSERPIGVDGDFTDTELVSLVLYIRSKPSPKAKGDSVAVGVSGTWPIIDIGRQPDGLVWIRMSDDGGVGETAIVRSTADGWQVTEVGWWVA